MPFPLIPFLSGAAFGSALTYLLTRRSEVIELRPPQTTAGTESAADKGSSAGPA